MVGKAFLRDPNLVQIDFVLVVHDAHVQAALGLFGGLYAQGKLQSAPTFSINYAVVSHTNSVKYWKCC